MTSMVAILGLLRVSASSVDDKDSYTRRRGLPGSRTRLACPVLATYFHQFASSAMDSATCHSPSSNMARSRRTNS